MFWFAPDILWRWVLALVLGIAGAYYLYLRKPGHRPAFPRPIRNLLFGLRSLSLSGLIFLLLAPRFSQTHLETIPPNIAIAIDNSLSMKYVSADSTQTLETIAKLKEELTRWTQKNDANISWHTLHEDRISPHQIRFNAPQTPLYAMLQRIHQLHTQRKENNFIGTLLFSDGLFNQGPAPTYLNVPKPIHTLSVKTNPLSKDIAITAVKYKKIVPVDHAVAVDLMLQQNGFLDQHTTLSLIHEENIISQTPIILSSTKLPFRIIIPAPSSESVEKYPDQRYQYILKVKGLPDELSLVNNEVRISIKLISQKIKVLLLSPTPHPDLKALSYALKEKNNYQVDLHILSLSDKSIPKKIKDYDIVLCYAAFSNPEMLQHTVFLWKNKIPTWYFLTTQAKASHLSQMPLGLGKADLLSTQIVMVAPYMNNSFSLFQGSHLQQNRIKEYPTLFLPDLQFSPYQGLEPLLFQRIGNTNTQYPLLSLGKGGSQHKIALSIGNGFWQWRQEEYLYHQTHKAFDKTIHQIIQYLGIRKNRNKFQVRPTQDTFMDTEPIRFQVTYLNDLDEPVYGELVHLNILEDNKIIQTQTFHTSPRNLLSIPPLPEGKYIYQARLAQNKDKKTPKASFYVQKNHQELISVQARPQILKDIAERSQGQFLGTDTQKIRELLDSIPLPRKSRKISSSLALSEIWYILLALTLIASTEWVIRKYISGQI
ncbi:MAG: hypothetical protein OXB93_00680 [Cytophagales bacterium]|nr:hypothetical protein [Cytophagales bacterium]